MSKPAKTAVSDAEAEETAVSSQYPNMLVLELPHVDGVALIVDPDKGSLTARQVSGYVKRDVPDALKGEGVYFQEMFVRAPLIDWRFKNLELTDEVLISMEYPAEIAYWTHQVTQPHLERIFSKKK
jgi:hypothetical protein